MVKRGNNGDNSNYDNDSTNNALYSQCLYWLLIWKYYKKTLRPLFMDVVQIPQGCKATTRRQFTFHD